MIHVADIECHSSAPESRSRRNHARWRHRAGDLQLPSSVILETAFRSTRIQKTTYAPVQCTTVDRDASFLSIGQSRTHGHTHTFEPLKRRR